MRGSHPFGVGLTERFKCEETQEKGRSWQKKYNTIWSKTEHKSKTEIERDRMIYKEINKETLNKKERDKENDKESKK